MALNTVQAVFHEYYHNWSPPWQKENPNGFYGDKELPFMAFNLRNPTP